MHNATVCSAVLSDQLKNIRHRRLNGCDDGKAFRVNLCKRDTSFHRSNDWNSYLLSGLQQTKFIKACQNKCISTLTLELHQGLQPIPHGLIPMFWQFD